MKMPLSPISGKGLSGWIFTPHNTSVSPRNTLAEPFALGIALISIDISLGSSSARPSTLFPCSSNSRICDLFNSSITDFDAISSLFLIQSICH